MACNYEPMHQISHMPPGDIGNWIWYFPIPNTKCSRFFYIAYAWDAVFRECHWHWFQVTGVCGKNGVHCLFMAVEWLTMISFLVNSTPTSSDCSCQLWNWFISCDMWLFSHFHCHLGIAIQYPFSQFIHFSPLCLLIPVVIFTNSYHINGINWLSVEG